MAGGTHGALTTAGEWGSRELPDVRRVAEGCLAGLGASTWGMGVGPAGIPGPVLAKLNADIRAALQVPSVVERHKTLGADIVSNTPDEMRAFVEAEMKKWGDAARAAGIQPQ